MSEDSLRVVILVLFVLLLVMHLRLMLALVAIRVIIVVMVAEVRADTNRLLRWVFRTVLMLLHQRGALVVSWLLLLQLLLEVDGIFDFLCTIHDLLVIIQRALIDVVHMRGGVRPLCYFRLAWLLSQLTFL